MKNMKKLFAMLTVAVIALVCFTACSNVSIASVGLPAAIEMEKGAAQTLEVNFGADKEGVKADAIAKAAEALTLVWSSDNEEVATVDQNGLVTAVGGGEANITVSIKDANIQSVCKVTVSVALEKIDAPESVELIINHKDTAELDVKLMPEDATNVTLKYESSDESVATVDADGKVTAVGNGECVITVSAGGVKTETAITVEIPVKVDTAPESLEAEDVEIAAGKTATLDVNTEGENITVGTEFSYASSDEDVATVDENGTVTAVAPGEATVTVTNELGQETTAQVVVDQPTTQPVIQQSGAPVAATTVPGTQPSAPVEATPQPAPAPAPVEATPTPAPAQTCSTCGLAIGGGCLFNGNHPAPPPSGGAIGQDPNAVIPGGGVWADEEIFEP